MKKNRLAYTLTLTALMTAVICVVAPLSIPIGPVPISLSILALFLSVYLLGWKLGTLSCLLYLLIGLLGVPVFSGFTGGVGKLFGPTGGYMIGYIPLCVLSGLVIDHYEKRWIHALGMTGGVLIAYTLGTAWFCHLMEMDIPSALSLCVFPFIPADIAKIIIALILGPMIRKRLRREGILQK